MRKTISLLVLLLLMPIVYSVFEPQPLTSVPLEMVDQPVAPGTGTQGECIDWEIKDEYCSGDIRHYTQCVKTASGGKWNAKSENCKSYASDVNCMAGSCIKNESIAKTALYIVGAVLLLTGLVFLLRRMKK